jgi:hypothetical protein
MRSWRLGSKLDDLLPNVGVHRETRLGPKGETQPG